MKSIPVLRAGFALLLALAVRTPASPILGGHPEAGPQYHWTHPADRFQHAYGWNAHDKHRHHHLDLHALVQGYGRRTSGSLAMNWGPERMEDAYRAPHGVCGGSPGAGLVHFWPEGPALNDPDDEEEPESEDAGKPVIAGEWHDGSVSAPGIPSVPEPGSLALMGAGMLGLAAAGAFRKRKR
jgi:hypothetical protein